MWTKFYNHSNDHPLFSYAGECSTPSPFSSLLSPFIGRESESPALFIVRKFRKLSRNGVTNGASYTLINLNRVFSAALMGSLLFQRLLEFFRDLLTFTRKAVVKIFISC